MGAVAVVAVAVLGAGAPGLATVADNADTSQQLVDLAQLNAHAITLAHSLADERDAMTAYVAAGRTGSNLSAAPTSSQRAQVDRQIGELRSDAQGSAGATTAFAAADKLLKELPQTRQKALAGPATADQVHDAYSQVVQALGAISDDIARGLPGRADPADADTRALPALGRAADQAASTRALLMAGLKAGGAQPRLTAAAQVAHIREQGALDDFNQAASQGGRDRYQRTVNGPDVDGAERYLTQLTDHPYLDPAAIALSRSRVQSALTARIGLMRGTESAMAAADVQRLGTLRDGDVDQLEIRIALAGACLLLAVGAGVWAARTMTQPLAALRLGAGRVAADPAHEEPVNYKGRNDEFAAAVRSVNALHAQVAESARRTAELEGERKRLVGGRQRLVAQGEVLQEQAETLKEEVADLQERLAALRTGVHGRFVNLALRTLGLVERQLGVIESLEESEQDPERLETLFKLDHFAARMRRNSENLLVLAGAEQHGGNHPGPVPLLDVLRAAVSEIERYERVRIGSLPPHSQLAGFAADDVSHLVAELLENATAFSPPDAQVELSGWLLESGELMLSVQDEGIGMTADRLAELNERLSEREAAEAAATSETVDGALGLGLYVVVRLAARHGVRVQLRAQEQGGIAAVVVLPGSILPTRPAPGTVVPGQGGAGTAPSLPGSVAEANSNTLQTRLNRLDPAPAEEPAAQDAPQPAPVETAEPAAAEDPFVAAAERAIDAAGLGTPAEPERARPAAAVPPAAPETAPAAEGPEPSPYGPRSSGPYATAAPAGTGGTAGEHTRTEDTVSPADGTPAPGKGRPAAPAPAAPAEAAPDAVPGPYAIGPDRHSRPEPGPAPTAAPERSAAPEAPAPAPRRTTATGLPKRTPKVVAQQQAPAAPRRTGTSHAEALRRRLGGFQQGARDGRRDVAAEIAEGTAEQTIPQTDTDGAGAPGERHVVEEATD
ncbi:nitrate- and nitrite sensing domain-containing protein [Streptomyces sp. GS7]|uniref:nitrate- and nitrite sensing domain-containing protein n=1 Tax=Streptomyces sp. GS7 TaxID=2692234 RepID=UPI001315E869|nr:nitrate- and nitrite sensing domain-containing protein [Streptomyces sp. GS7]QHC25466.1 histidine kinase [Streptomyces sp. GS7]